MREGIQFNGHEFGQTPGRTGKPGMLQSTGSQRVRNDLATKQQPSMRNMGKVTSYCANEEKDIVILI